MALLSENSKKAIVEAFKEFLRFMWFGLIGLVVAYLSQKFLGGDNTTVVTIVVGLIVKFLDKYAKENDNIPVKGLAPGFLQK